MFGRAVAVLLLLGGSALADPFPAKSGIVDVRDFGAKGDGETDDTSALLKAIASSGDDSGPSFWQDRIIYLPTGTYRISAPLVKRYGNGGFGSGMILIGESRERTIIRLADHAAGYDDAKHPRAVLFTSSKLIDGTPTSGGKNYAQLGEGNDAYMNFVENLTIDVGEANPGAIALDYLGNNIGAIRHVTLRAPAGSGAIGLAMTRKWPGPTLVQDIDIEGFATGIATAQTEYGLTFEHLRLRGQTATAWHNSQNSLAIRDIEASGPAAILVNEGDKGFVAIEDGKIGALQNESFVTARRLSIAGQTHDGVLRGMADWSSAKEPERAEPLVEPPSPPTTPSEKWASAATFGASGDPEQDATEALRKAVASGADTLILPHGTYMITDSIEIPASLQRIVGMNSTLRVMQRRSPNFPRFNGMFRILTDGSPLFIERMAFDNSNQGDQLALELSGGRDLVVRDVVSAGVTMLDRKEHGGRAFLEDICCGRLQLAGPRPVVARQFDTEGGGIRIANKGAPLSILGIKTEGVCIVVDNRDGARTDIFGGLLYVVRDGAGATIPAFQNADGWLSASFVEESLRDASRYQVYLARAPAVAFPQRGYGRFVPDLRDRPGS